jgi:hypothetical protein
MADSSTAAGAIPEPDRDGAIAKLMQAGSGMAGKLFGHVDRPDPTGQFRRNSSPMAACYVSGP